MQEEKRREKAAEMGVGQHRVLRTWPEIPAPMLPSHVGLGKSLTSLCLNFFIF